VFLPRCYSADHIKEYDIGEICDTRRGNKSERDHTDDPDMNGSVLLYHILKLDGKIWTEIVWLRTGKIGGIL